MSDTADALVIMAILLVAVWIGFLIMAVQWILTHWKTVFAAFLLLVLAAIVADALRR